MWIEANYDAYDKQGFDAYYSAMSDYDEDNLDCLKSLVDFSEDIVIDEDDNFDDDSYFDDDSDSKIF